MKALFSLLVVAMAIAATARPAPATSLSFVPSSASVSLGSPASVALHISGLAELAAPSLGVFDVEVSFDPAIVSFAGAVYGDGALGDQLDLLGLGSVVVTTLGPGTVNLFELSLDSAEVLNGLQAGDFTLATLTFDTLGTGASPLGLTINALGDADGGALVAAALSGSITVPTAPPTVPLPPTLLLLIGALVLLTAGGPGRQRVHPRPCRGLKPLGRRGAWREDRGAGGKCLARSAARKAYAATHNAPW